jgi:hypothetical protein
VLLEPISLPQETFASISGDRIAGLASHYKRNLRIMRLFLPDLISKIDVSGSNTDAVFEKMVKRIFTPKYCSSGKSIPVCPITSVLAHR